MGCKSCPNGKHIDKNENCDCGRIEKELKLSTTDGTNVDTNLNHKRRTRPTAHTFRATNVAVTEQEIGDNIQMAQSVKNTMTGQTSNILYKTYGGRGFYQEIPAVKMKINIANGNNNNNNTKQAGLNMRETMPIYELENTSQTKPSPPSPFPLPNLPNNNSSTSSVTGYNSAVPPSPSLSTTYIRSNSSTPSVTGYNPAYCTSSNTSSYATSNTSTHTNNSTPVMPHAPSYPSYYPSPYGAHYPPPYTMSYPPPYPPCSPYAPRLVHGYNTANNRAHPYERSTGLRSIVQEEIAKILGNNGNNQ